MTYDVFTEPDTASMRTDGDSKLGRHQQDGQDLAHTSQSTRVDLTHVDGFGLQELLEGHSVVSVFTGGDTDPVGLELLPDRGVTKRIIRRGGLLDEPGQVNEVDVSSEKLRDRDSTQLTKA